MEVLYNSEFHWNSESLTFNISLSFFINIIATKATNKSPLLSQISMTIFINIIATKATTTEVIFVIQNVYWSKESKKLWDGLLYWKVGNLILS